MNVIIVFQIFIVIIFPSQLLAQDSYGKVYNEGLSKMEMIEQIDKYLSGKLPNQLKNLEDELKRQKSQNQKQITEIKTMLTNMNSKLEQMDVSQDSNKKIKKEAISDEMLTYLNDLKKVIIPAIQQKLLLNESQMNDFIKQMTAKLNTEKLIKDEVKEIKSNEVENE